MLDSLPPPALFASATSSTGDFYHTTTRSRKQEVFRHEVSVCYQLATLQREEQKRPRDAWVHECLAVATAHQQVLFDQKAEFAFHAREVFWMQFGGKVNKQFFSAHGPRHCREKVSQLIDSLRDLQTDPDVVMDIAYASLLIANTLSHATLRLEMLYGCAFQSWCTHINTESCTFH